MVRTIYGHLQAFGDASVIPRPLGPHPQQPPRPGPFLASSALRGRPSAKAWSGIMTQPLPQGDKASEHDPATADPLSDVRMLFRGLAAAFALRPRAVEGGLTLVPCRRSVRL